MNLSQINHLQELGADMSKSQRWEKQHNKRCRIDTSSLRPSMDSRCEQCRKYVRQSPPFSLVRITEGEMKSYYTFLRKCAELEEMAQTGMLKSLVQSEMSSSEIKILGERIFKASFSPPLSGKREREENKVLLNCKERDVE